ncbi:probable serine/threonine-protein kinase CST [Andrographis paniculata]|uniref:probable serine/threonine-protein kinase CST n=1 Tax=Andrographis paniculata TaxID=175694 RepID=UPI0021E91A2D|nr:probable serine/threonine-protein kinase CST [Andrographis paniculata]
MGNCCFTPSPTTPVSVPQTFSGEPTVDGGITTPASPSRRLKIFSLAELRSATGDFPEESVVGEGGFGKVYKGYIDKTTHAPSKAGHPNAIAVAIKKSNPHGEQGLKEWKAEVKFLGKFKHPNLVKLLGLCWEEKQYLLVYEFMEGGNLADHLFNDEAIIPWDTRIKIALGAATGLSVLHSTGQENVIYRDFKASNILLDLDFNAKMSDFGLAKLGPAVGNSHVTTQIVGTFGYAAPEYVATGHLYVKSDVYSFGVLLLEMMTGRRVVDFDRPGGEVNLVDWAKPLLPSKKGLNLVMDLRLNGLYPSRGAYKMAKLILNCLEPDPKRRPDMSHVLKCLEDISNIKNKPKRSRP